MPQGFQSQASLIEMMLNKGIPMSEAWDWNPCGCVETNLTGKQRCYTSYADYNMGSAVEFVLLNGRSRKYDRQASIQTGDPRDFKTFDEFLKAIKDQLAYEIKAIVAGNHVNDDIGFERVCPALSLSFYECIENAKDYADGLNTAMDTRMQAVEGAKHTHSNKAVLDGITQDMVDAWNTADTEYTEAEVTAMWNEVFGA